MSVIIRLQNLPWSANALDIRQYFAGLSIPEGGVHIVGGEQGDAFIAFSTDEDARQAMLIDGGKIKEVKIKLFLSSRTEMQKVIETARQQTLNLQNFMQMSGPQIPTSIPTPQIPTPQIPAPQIPISQIPTPQIPVPPILPTNLPVHPAMMNQVAPAINQAVPVKIMTPGIKQMTPTVPPIAIDQNEIINHEIDQEKKDTDLESNTSKDKRDRRDRSRTRDRSRDRSKSRDRRDFRSRDRDRYRDRRRRERSRSRDRRRRTNKERSRSRDRNVRRNTSRERRRDDYERNVVKNVSPENKEEGINAGQTGFGSPGWMPTNNKPPLLPNPPMTFKQSGIPGSNQKGPLPASPNVNGPQDHDGRSSLPSTLGYTPPNRSSLQPNSPFSKTSQVPSRRNEGFQQNKMQNVGDSMPLHNRESWPPSRHMHDSRGSVSDHDREGPGNPNRMSGTSINDRKGMNNFNFHETRSNFKASSGGELPFHQSNPRHQNSYGNNSARGSYRQDRSYSQLDRFSSNDRTGQYGSRPYDQRYKPTFNVCVEVRNMSPATSYSDIRRFFHGLHIPAEGLKIISDCQGNRIGIVYVRFAKPYAKEQALKKNGSMLRNTVVEVLHIDDELFDKASDCSLFADEKHELDEKRRIEPEEDFQCLMIKDLPTNFKDKDLQNAFNHWRIEDKFILSKTGRRPATGYVKFYNCDDARKALNAIPRLMVGNKGLEVCVCDDEEFQDARDRKNMEEEDMDEDDRLNSDSADVKQSNESHPPTQDQRSVSSSKYSSSSKPEEKKTEHQQGLLPTPNIPPMALVPLPTQVPDDDTGSNPDKTDMDIDEEDDVIKKRSSECLIVRGLPYDANDRDIVDFFGDENVSPTQIHIMLDKMGNPAGDAFCEFNSSEDASQALKKHNKFIRRSKVSVMPVSRDEMLDALGVPHGERSQYSMAGPTPPLMMVRMPFRPPLFPHPQRSGPRPGPPNRHIDSMSWPNGFGRPGCVLALENVPFRAGVEEIVDFFRVFGITREQIIRRFDDHGRPTGDARVCLNNPSDAQRALKVLNHKTIRQRPIYMRLAG